MCILVFFLTSYRLGCKPWPIHILVIFGTRMHILVFSHKPVQELLIWCKAEVPENKCTWSLEATVAADFQGCRGGLD